MTQPVDPARNRSIRVFVSSTFRDMVEEREALMSHTWPALRQFCREREVDFVEVDLRWGIPEEQATRNETLKICLQEIHACRPYFIALLGERYGWVPGPEALTPDLLEEEPWLQDHQGKSVAELEILHGLLKNPDAGRSFVYIRDPAYVQAGGAEHQPEGLEAADRQAALKATVRATCAAKGVPLREDYPNPVELAKLVLEDLRSAIDADYPKESIPDPLTRDARGHEAFAEVRRRTYIGRPDYFDTLDQHAQGDGIPLVLLGESGSGKSALLANWVAHRRTSHPQDLIIQHYIGSTPDSADHWQLMRRIITEIKRWTEDPEAIPHTHDDLHKTFPVWLAKARSKADHIKVRCILVLDALNQLHEQDHARLLGWLPVHSFTGALRMITSMLPGETLQVAESRGWVTVTVEPLTTEECRRMIAAYLKRFRKKLDESRTERLVTAPQAENPLYLKILLDELRVTGTHDQLDDRLNEYLKAQDIPALLQLVLTRYQRDYEHDRPGLVGDTFGLIWAARRGLSETELLELLKSADQPQLPQASWAPLRAALEDVLIDRGGLLNFAHDYLHITVESAFISDEDQRDDLRLRLADYFEQQPVAPRNCDELPWLLNQTESFTRLRACLLNIDRVLEVYPGNKDELMAYWVALKEERAMGSAYLTSFDRWAAQHGQEEARISLAANQVWDFLYAAALHREAEPLIRRALAIDEARYGQDHGRVSIRLNNLAQLLEATNRLAEAEPLRRRALAIDEACCGPDDPEVGIKLNNLAQLLKATNRLVEAEALMRRALAIAEVCYGPDHPEVATRLNNLALLFQDTNRLAEAELLLRRALAIRERGYGTDHPVVGQSLNNLAWLLGITDRLVEAESLMRRALAIAEVCYGPDHPEVATRLNNLALLFQDTNRLVEAESLMRRALAIAEACYGPDHPEVGIKLNNLALLLKDTNRLVEAEPLLRRALAIRERSYGADHPVVAQSLNNLAVLFQDTNRLVEAEPLLRRALAIREQSYGPAHPDVAQSLGNLAVLFQDTSRLAEAEPLMRRALAIDEVSYGPDHPNVAIRLNNLALLLKAINRLGEAEPVFRRSVIILLKFGRATDHDHPRLQRYVNNYVRLLSAMNRTSEEALAELNNLAMPYGASFKYSP